MGNQLHCRHSGAGLHVDLPNDSRKIALLVADCKLNRVNTIRQRHICNAHNPARDGARSFHAINIGSCGGFVQPCVVGLVRILLHRCAKGEHIACGFSDCPSCKGSGITHAGICPRHLFKNGCFAILNRRGIIDGNIIDIEIQIDIQ